MEKSKNKKIEEQNDLSEKDINFSQEKDVLSQNNKEDFSFVNTDDDINDFLLEDETEDDTKVVLPKNVVNDLNKREKRKKIRRVLITSAVLFGIALFLFWFAILWQWRLDLLAVCNGLWFAGFILFFAGWIMFVYNHNVLSPFIHGIKTFGNMIIGRRPKMKYYDYMKKIQDNPIPKYYYLVTLIASGILFIPALIITLVSFL